MYHPRTTRKRTWWQHLIAAFLVVGVCLAVGGIVFSQASSVAREQSALSLRDAILNSAKQCCAIEGSYPQSLDYLENHYGLVINRSDYLVTYECYADNVVPSVVVIPR